MIKARARSGAARDSVGPRGRGDPILARPDGRTDPTTRRNGQPAGPRSDPPEAGPTPSRVPSAVLASDPLVNISIAQLSTDRKNFLRIRGTSAPGSGGPVAWVAPGVGLGPLDQAGRDQLGHCSGLGRKVPARRAQVSDGPAPAFVMKVVLSAVQLGGFDPRHD